MDHLLGDISPTLMYDLTFRMLGFPSGRHTMYSQFGRVPYDFAMDQVMLVLLWSCKFSSGELHRQRDGYQGLSTPNMGRLRKFWRPWSNLLSWKIVNWRYYFHISLIKNRLQVLKMSFKSRRDWTTSFHNTWLFPLLVFVYIPTSCFCPSHKKKRWILCIRKGWYDMPEVNL